MHLHLINAIPMSGLGHEWSHCHQLTMSHPPAERGQQGRYHARHQYHQRSSKISSKLCRENPHIIDYNSEMFTP